MSEARQHGTTAARWIMVTVISLLVSAVLVLSISIVDEHRLGKSYHTQSGWPYDFVFTTMFSDESFQRSDGDYVVADEITVRIHWNRLLASLFVVFIPTALVLSGGNWLISRRLT